MFRFVIIFIMCFAMIHLQAQNIPVVFGNADSLQQLLPYRFVYKHTINTDTSMYTPAPSLKPKVDSARVAKRTLHWQLYYDFYTTLSAIHTINNLNPAEINNLYGYYNIDLKQKLSYRKIVWDAYLFNDYGVRHYFDSITTKTQDQFTFKNTLNYSFYKEKIAFSFSANTQTKLFPTYQYRLNAQSEMERYLYDGFMSPGVIVYNGGITYRAPHDATLNIGLGSSKVTKIRNQTIFDTREVTKINGLEKGRKRKSSYGLNLTLTVPMQEFKKHLHWEFFGNAFAPMNKLSDFHYYTIDINNALHVILLKHIRVSWRTKLSFNADQNPKPVIQNQLSFGFYLNNRL